MNDKFCDNPQCKNGLHKPHGGYSSVIGADGRTIFRYEWGVGTPSQFALCCDCSETAHNMIKKATESGLTKDLSVGCQSVDNLPRALGVEPHHIEPLEAGTKKHIVLEGEVRVNEPMILLANEAKRWSAAAVAISANSITWKAAFDYVEQEIKDEEFSAAIVDYRERHPGIKNEDWLTIIQVGVIPRKEE